MSAIKEEEVCRLVLWAEGGMVVARRTSEIENSSWSDLSHTRHIVQRHETRFHIYDTTAIKSACETEISNRVKEHLRAISETSWCAACSFTLSPPRPQSPLISGISDLQHRANKNKLLPAHSDTTPTPSTPTSSCFHSSIRHSLDGCS